MIFSMFSETGAVLVGSQCGTQREVNALAEYFANRLGRSVCVRIEDEARDRGEWDYDMEFIVVPT